MQNNLKVAITGGIGSGKSVVASIIAEQGYNVVSCDEIYKNLLQDKNFLKVLSAEFACVLDGVLDRKKLSKIVFNDAEKLKKLNYLTHPVIMQTALSKMQGDGINFCEVPLLFEGGYEKLFDKVIVVLRDTAARINSVAVRDNIDVSAVEKRISNQIDYDNYDFTNYYVLHNNGSIDKLRVDTFQILKNLKN
ncbi:MAG: dephospho-CoA kinase [Clostridia bacterium]|nr:dephospho-CoA kinase [Clostridia bacterium]